jgi:hypothetical protein
MKKCLAEVRQRSRENYDLYQSVPACVRLRPEQTFRGEAGWRSH